MTDRESGWQQCSKDQYWGAVNSRDSIVRVEREQTLWQTRYGAPVAKSTVGYARPAGVEVFYVWRN